MSLIYRFVNIFEKSNLTDLSKNVNVTLFELKKRKPDASEEDKVQAVLLPMCTQFHNQQLI